MKLLIREQLGSSLDDRHLGELLSLTEGSLLAYDFVQLDLTGVKMTVALIEAFFSKLNRSFEKEDLLNRFRILCPDLLMNTKIKEVFYRNNGVKSDVGEI